MRATKAISLALRKFNAISDAVIAWHMKALCHASETVEHTCGMLIVDPDKREKKRP